MATINGTHGGDSLYGTASADVINGLNGNDTLKGFGGADRLDGGAGIDTAFYGDSGAGPDIVTNLTGRKATCSTSPIWMRTRLSPATRISPSSAWRRSRRRARSAGPTNGVDTFIQLNTNADPTVDGIIQVLGVHTVDVSWFSQ